MSEKPCVFCGRPVVITHWWQRLYKPSDSCFGKDLAQCHDLFIVAMVGQKIKEYEERRFNKAGDDLTPHQRVAKWIRGQA